MVHPVPIDVAQINKMVSYGRMELEEVLMLWKGDSHVNNFFDAARAASWCMR